MNCFRNVAGYGYYYIVAKKPAFRKLDLLWKYFTIFTFAPPPEFLRFTPQSLIKMLHSFIQIHPRRICQKRRVLPNNFIFFVPVHFGYTLIHLKECSLAVLDVNTV